MGAAALMDPAAAEILGSDDPGTRDGPEIADGYVLFRLHDPKARLERVKLHQDLERPRDGPPLSYDARTNLWTLRFARPSVDRMEYKFELHEPVGRTEVICDPGNATRAPGPFGDKSVIEFPGYEPPGWITEKDDGRVTELRIRCRPLRAHLPVELWIPPDADPKEPLPLLIVHDGLEYRRFSLLGCFLSQMIATQRIPRLRAALIGPVERNASYSASAAYARSFVHEVLPAIEERAPTPHGRSARIGVGASLGALSMLHIHRRNPSTFGALFLQSGSFFRQRFDKQEMGFPWFRRISRFVGEVLAAEAWASPIPVTMTCGAAEENLYNNRATGDALQAQGYDIVFAEHRDAHNWTAWRDALDPGLTQLIARRWG